MAISTSKTAETFLNVVAGTPIACDWPLYAEDELQVVYGFDSLPAELNVDYTVTLSHPDYDQFTITPLAALLDKINTLINVNPTNEQNYITVRRVLDNLTSVTPETVRGVNFLSREIERLWMSTQQLTERLLRTVTQRPKSVGQEAAPLYIDDTVANAIVMGNSTGDGLTFGPTVQELLGTAMEDFSVKRFGATGDGVTNDTAAIQAAIDSGISVIYFPAGTYIHDQLLVRSNQTWLGDGANLSILSWPQVNRTDIALRGYVSGGTLHDVTFHKLQFRGNATVQVTNDVTGQYLWGFWFRLGDNYNIVWDNCTIREWGSKNGAIFQQGGGAIALGAGGDLVTGGTNNIASISIVNCAIGDNANVPGVYFSGLGLPLGSSARRIYIANNHFWMNESYAFQNMIYLVGYANRLFEDVVIQGNTFEIADSIDSAIELNFTNGFSICDNIFKLTGVGECEGTLLRSEVRNGVISNNVYANNGTGAALRTALSIPNFGDGTTQSDIVISGNTFKDWGAAAISIATYCERITVADNTILGSTYTIGYGVSVANALDVTITGNVMKNVSAPVSLGGTTYGAKNVLVSGNVFNDCGSVGGSIISTPLAGVLGENVYVTKNSVVNPKAGMLYFWGCAFQTAKGNRLVDNEMPESLTDSNPSYDQYIDTKVIAAKGSGAVTLKNTYAFSQGAINMIPYTSTIDWPNPGTQKSSYVIGLNLDGAGPVCEPGDAVLVACTADLQGANVTAYVPLAGQVRITVTNPKSINLDIAAGTWYVTILRKPPFSKLGNRLRLGTDQSGLPTESGDGRFTLGGDDVTLGTDNSVSMT